MIIAVLLATHFVADFVLQSREMGKNKSSNFNYLFIHLFIQMISFLIVVAFINADVAVEFAISNAAIHGVIDWNIWRLYKAYAYKRIKQNPQHPLLTGNPAEPWKYWEDHMFYTTIGFDQLLHGLTIVLLAGVFHL
jgi:Protein of unknown function (DUF3307)